MKYSEQDYPVELEKEKLEIINLYSKLIWRTKKDFKSDNDNDVVAFVLKDLIDRSLWNVTKIRSGPRFKYVNQRYISEGVYQAWKNIPVNSALKDFIKDKNTKKIIVRHEHVNSRKSLSELIYKSLSEFDIKKELEKAMSCVVTLEEDAKLDNLKEGWERYSSKGIKVYDRLSKDWMNFL